MIIVSVNKFSEGLGFSSRVWDDPEEEYLRIDINFWKKLTSKQAIREFKVELDYAQPDWIYYKDYQCHINLDVLKSMLELERLRIHTPQLPMFEFLTGILVIEPEVEDYEAQILSKKRLITKLSFELNREIIMNLTARKIFLSHKGVDKPLIREYKRTLETLGFEPWIDEDSLIAGAELERGLLKGFKESCAAIFFLTENYKDENYLASEIDYAIAQKREKGDRFAIITLVLNEKAIVPELLKRYVWKTPPTQLEAIREIIKAIPLKLGVPTLEA